MEKGPSRASGVNDHRPRLYAVIQEVYKHVGVPQLDSMFDGYNGCIFAYGQTSSGKTHSMMGYPGHGRGVTPRLCEEMFTRIGKVLPSDGDCAPLPLNAVLWYRCAAVILQECCALRGHAVQFFLMMPPCSAAGRLAWRRQREQERGKS